MKFKKIMLALIGLLLLVACSSQGNLNKEAAEKLSSDLTVADVMINEKVYTLPLSLNTFIEDGWKIEGIEDPDKTLMTGKTEAEFELTYEGYYGYISAVVLNDSDKEVTLTSDEAVVHVLDFSYSTENNNSKTMIPVVLKAGITEKTSEKVARKALMALQNEGKDSDEDEKKGEGIVDEEGNVVLDLSYSSGKIIYLQIGDSDKSSFDYLAFETKEQKIENIKRVKEEIESSGASYKGDYKGYTEEVKKSRGSAPSILIDLTIVEETESVTEGSFFDGMKTSIYVGEDSDGNFYAISKPLESQNAYVPWPKTLKNGDKIKVWATPYQELYTSEDNSEYIPLVIPKIVEKGDKIIYRAG